MPIRFCLFPDVPIARKVFDHKILQAAHIHRANPVVQRVLKKYAHRRLADIGRGEEP